MIELQNISFRYKGIEQEPVIKEVDLTIKEGEWVSVLGPSGSGKTTLLNIIGGLERPTAGAIAFKETNYEALSLDEIQAFRRQRIGFVFQHYRLFNQYSVLENVMIPQMPFQRKNDIEARAKKLLTAVQMGHRLAHLPEQLSGGEKQRTAIARALLNEPDVLLCDEPTGNLDGENREKVLDLLKKLNDDGKTIIVVTHDNEVATYGSRELYLRDGVIQEEVQR